MRNFYDNRKVSTRNDICTSRFFVDASNEKTISNSELFVLFSEISTLIKECVDRLSLENSYIQYRVLHLGAEILANTNRNKIIFTRGVDIEDDKIIDIKNNNKELNATFLCSCMDLGLSVYKEDVLAQNKIINNLFLSRMVLNNFIDAWVKKVDTYLSKCFSHAECVLDGNIVKEQELAKEIFDLECANSLDHQFGYGLVEHITFNVNIIRKIKEKIYKAYSRLVLKSAKNLSSIFNDSVDDYMQFGSFGLMRAIDSYDYLSNAKFPGYAKWWVRQQIFYYIKTGSAIIKMSSIIWQQYTKLESVKSKLESKYGPNLDTKLLADKSGFSEKEISNIYTHVLTSQVKSLETQVVEEDINDVDTFEPCTSLYEDKELPIDIISLLELLPFELRKIMYLKFGIV